jgi:hypothetical protein
VVQHVTAVGWSYQFNKTLVTKRWLSTSATTIAEDVIATYTSDSFVAAVEQGLATVGEFQLTMMPAGDALTRLADRIGGYWRIEDDKRVRFFLSESDYPVPETINSANRHTRDFRHGTDIDSLFNRVYVEGQGTTVLDPVAVGQTTFAVADASMFNASGGDIKADHGQILTYTGRTLGGGDGSTAAHNEAVPASAPTVAEGATSGNLTGSYTYKVTYANATGETAAGAASSAVTPDAHAAPTSAMSASDDTTAWGGLTVGTNNYGYKYSWVTALGETTAGGALANDEVIAVVPSTLIGSPSATTGGSMALGTYYYKYTFGTPDGESTLVSTASSGVTLTGSNDAVSLASGNIPDPPTRASFRLYRTPVGGSSSGGYYFVDTIDATANYTDTTADANLGPRAPSVSTSGGVRNSISGIANGGTGTIAKRIYRTKSGGSEYFLIGQINDNTTTTFTDSVPDSALSLRDSVSNTAGGETVNLTSIPTGGATVVTRRLYRTRAGGTAHYFLDEIEDNVTTTYTDNTPDESLGAIAPTQSTIAANIGDTSIRVLETGNFNATGGWVEVGQQRISYTGRSASSGEGTLTGIPASGEGAITSGITAGDSVVPIGFVSGVAASGTGSVLVQLESGDAVNLLVTRNDAASQATYGIREHYIQDRRLSETGAENRGDASLSLHDLPRTAGSLVSTDPKVRAGKALTIDIYGISETRTIQSVDISYQGDRPYPQRRASFSSRTESDFYSELRAIREQSQGQ